MKIHKASLAVLYFDTSFLVPLLLPEPTSDAITAFVVTLPADRFAVSHWTRVEFSSLMARHVRMRALDAATAARIDARFDDMIHESFAVLLPDSADFDLARAFLGEPGTGLRAGDALHLAIARNNHSTVVYSLDKTLLKAGTILGVPVSSGPVGSGC